jgi:hypothetical protein
MRDHIGIIPGPSRPRYNLKDAPKKKQSRTKVVQPDDEPVPTEVLATAILEISEGMMKINSGKLNRRALLVLLKDASGVSMSDIDKVLNHLEDLGKTYLKKQS